MATDNEKVADIVCEMHDMQFDWAVPCDVRPVFRLYADRLKAANKRETSMKLLAAETWIKKANDLRDKLCAAERKIAELRECLKEAVFEYCHDCIGKDLDSDTCKDETKNVVCFVKKWRKALEEGTK